MDLRAHHKPTFDNISAEKRSRILDAATNEFAVKGFENGNIGTIAKKAGVSVGSLYKYFENKQDLFLTVVQHSISQMEELLNVLAVSDEDILIKVEKIIRTIQSSSRESAVLVKLYNAMTAEKFVWAWFKSEFLMPKKLTFRSTNTYYEMMKPGMEHKQKEVSKAND